LNDSAGWNVRSAMRGGSRHLPLLALMVSALSCATPAFADDSPPSWDRPGIAFSPAVLPAGSFDWEQGLPDLQHDSADGVHATDYTADTNLRYGLTSNLEVQLLGSLWNRLDVSGMGLSSQVQGAGDTRLSLKWAPTLSTKGLSFAMLGGVTFDTGSAAFTSGTTIETLGATLGKDLGSGRSIAAYANIDHSSNANVWTTSVNFGFPINGNLGGYLEVGHVDGNGATSTVAGGGVTYLVTNRVQFDLYARHGLTSESPDVQAGFGISVFWK
jgi:hypothetical protein